MTVHVPLCMCECLTKSSLNSHKSTRTQSTSAPSSSCTVRLVLQQPQNSSVPVVLITDGCRFAAAVYGDWTARRRGSSPRRRLGWILLREKVMSVAVPAERVAGSSSPSSAASGLVRDCLVVSRRPRTWAIRREKSLLCCFPAWNTSSTYGKKKKKTPHKSHKCLSETHLGSCNIAKQH